MFEPGGPQSQLMNMKENSPKGPHSKYVKLPKVRVLELALSLTLQHNHVATVRYVLLPAASLFALRSAHINRPHVCSLFL